MPRQCTPFVHVAPDGTIVSGIATRHVERRLCSAEAGNCNKPATKQCDYPIRFGTKSKGTCDRYLCAAHAHDVEGQPDTHYCPVHHRKAAADGAGR
jgi:hypothetical protein